MAKKKSSVNFILSIVGLVTAALTFVALAFDFITKKVITKTILGTTTEDSTNLKLNDWLDNMHGMQEFNENLEREVYNLTGWNMARAFLVITLVLVAIVAVALVIKLVMNNKLVNLLTVVASALCIVSAIVFMVTTFVGCGALSGTVNWLAGDSTLNYVAGLGVYILTVCAIATGVLAALSARKK